MIPILFRTTDSITQEQFLVDRNKTHRSETRKAKRGGLFERSYIGRRIMVPKKFPLSTSKPTTCLFLKSVNSCAVSTQKPKDAMENFILNPEIAFPNFAVFP